MYPLIGAICIKMQEKLIQKYQTWDRTGSIPKQQSAGIWKRILGISGYEEIIREDHQNCSTKEKYLTTNQALARRDGNYFCKKK